MALISNLIRDSLDAWRINRSRRLIARRSQEIDVITVHGSGSASEEKKIQRLKDEIHLLERRIAELDEGIIRRVPGVLGKGDAKPPASPGKGPSRL